MYQEDILQQEGSVGADQVAEAERILQKYKSGKAALDRRIIDNELWFRMAHWKQYKNRMMESKPQPSSGWLFNSIASKHADAMDNYPEPNVLPRAADDEATARTLLQHPAGGAGTGRLRAGLLGQLVAEAQAGYRGQGDLLGPRRPGRAG